MACSPLTVHQPHVCLWLQQRSVCLRMPSCIRYGTCISGCGTRWVLYSGTTMERFHCNMYLQITCDTATESTCIIVLMHISAQLAMPQILYIQPHIVYCMLTLAHLLLLHTGQMPYLQPVHVHVSSSFKLQVNFKEHRMYMYQLVYFPTIFLSAVTDNEKYMDIRSTNRPSSMYRMDSSSRIILLPTHIQCIFL